MATAAPTSSGPLDVARLRGEFPALLQQVHGRPLVYLDSAATSQRPNAVIDAVADFYRRDNANVHRGIYELSRRATERFEAARETVARFINAPRTREVIWVRGTTEAINLVAMTWGWSNIREGDEVVLTLLEHHSNIVPWQILTQRTGARLRYIDVDGSGQLRLDQLDEYLAGGRVRLVSVGHVSNALGTINPVADICRRAHDAGALVMVDGAQAAPHMMTDVQAIGCDFYAISGHKMCGPMGIGALWGRSELLDAMPPFHGGGEMIEVVEADRSTYAPVPHKFEAGTPNVAGAIGMAVAVDFLEGLGREAVAAHEAALVRYGLERLCSVDRVRVFGPANPAQRTAAFSFELEGIHPHDLATILDSEGIAIRAGHHCTQPLMRRLGVAATTRASAYIYNMPEDFDRLADGLAAARRIFQL